MAEDTKILKVSKGKRQRRVTIPWDSDYIIARPMKPKSLQEAFKKDVKK